MMRHQSWSVMQWWAAIGTAAVVCLIGTACADATAPGPASTLVPSAPSMDRQTPTFEYETIDVPGAASTSPQGINANGDISGGYTAGGRTQVRDLRAGSSYLGQNDLRLHFGLGDAALVGRVEVTWPSGRVDLVSGVRANHVVTIQEGRGIVSHVLFAR